ncbi:MAG: NIL domain-containing protein [Planctomycetota bacterium]
MGLVTKECRIRVGERAADGPLLWRMSRVLPAVMFDIRQADLPHAGERERTGMVTLRLEGEADEVEEALDYLEREGAALMDASDRLRSAARELSACEPCDSPARRHRARSGKAKQLAS